MVTRFFLLALIAVLLLVIVWMAPTGLAVLATPLTLLVAWAILKTCKRAAEGTH